MIGLERAIRKFVAKVTGKDPGNMSAECLIEFAADHYTAAGGVVGEKGDKGDRGEQGEKGEKGDPGSNGVGIQDIQLSLDGNELKFDFKMDDGSSIERSVTIPIDG